MSSEVRVRDAVDRICQRGASPEYKSTLQKPLTGEQIRQVYQC
jgi:hypothetical protein